MVTTDRSTRVRMTEWQESGGRQRDEMRDKQPAEVERKALYNSQPYSTVSSFEENKSSIIVALSGV